MKTLLIVALALTTTPALAWDTHVNGYFRNNGTYVQPHYRSQPDAYRSNNWSTQGNVNPYTGRQGTQSPFGSSNYGSTRNNSYGTRSYGNSTDAYRRILGNGSGY